MRSEVAGRLGDEQGAVILWSLGLVLILFFAGAVAMDLWRVVTYHGTLTGLADKAAVAGATGVDVALLYRNDLVLIPEEAVRKAEAFAQSQPHWEGDSMTVRAFADSSTVWVELTGTVELTLLEVFSPSEGISLTVQGRASPARFD